MSHKTQHNEYDTDFYAWSLHNAALIREGKLSEVDLENVAEEIESMGKGNKRELINQLSELLSHLLKWKFQSGRRGKSWELTIKEQRLKLQSLLEESPSLKHELDKHLTDAYEIALLIAARETGLDEKIFPKTCPFSLNESLKNDFFPK
ncbi:MAG: DUF29 domain-containing protein [Proteobacteria bacterium]|nr:DUF29 domain-containing protein [Pseudomonadota bacterium]